MLLNKDIISDKFKSAKRTPTLFIGHGNPMLVLETPDSHPFTKHLSELGNLLTTHFKIDAICVVSAHWLTRGTHINISNDQKTIHDFGGFPDQMYQIDYPTNGHTEIAKEIVEQIDDIKPTSEWGLDHGAWTVLMHLFPDADIPAFQLSIDYHNSMDYHLNIAKQLQQFRDQNILILGSGNIVHNLQLAIPRMMQNQTTPFGWETDFDSWFEHKSSKKEFKALADYKNHKHGLESVPTPDHYIPALYTLGSSDESDEMMTTYEEILPAISMRSFVMC